MSGSKGLKRYNGVEQDDEGAYVYYDEHIAALRRAKAEGRIKSMWEAVHIANTYNCDHNHGKKATEAVDNVLLKLYDRIAELEADARAAQIERGSDVFCSTKKTNCRSRTADFARDKSS